MRIDLTTELTPTQLDQWARFLAQARTSHPEQDPCFAPVLRADGRDVAFAMGWQGSDLVAVALFSLRPHPFLKGRYSDAMTYSGPVCDDRAHLLEFIEKLQATALFRKVGRIRITPYWLGEEGRAFGPVLTGLGWHVFENEPIRHTGLISLAPTETEIYEKFTKSARYEYRKAQRLSMKVEHVVDQARAIEVMELLNRHRRARRMGPIEPGSFLASFTHVFSNPSKAIFAVATHEGQIVAGISVYCGYHGTHGPHFFTVPDELRKLQNLRIAPFLWHYVAVWSKASGMNWMDVEGYKADTGAGDRLYNVHKYKGDLGAVEIVRVAGHARILHPFLYLTGNLREIARRRAKAALALVPRRSAPAPQTAD